MLLKLEIDIKYCIVTHARREEFNVLDGMTSFTVNLTTRHFEFMV